MSTWQYMDLGDGVMRPYLVVWRDPAIRFPAIVDSGADGSAFPLQIAIALGIPYDPTAPIQASGAGGPYQCWRATASVTLSCAEGDFTLAPPTISPLLSFILLGRSDFFRIFHVAISEPGRTFTLTRYPANPGP